MKEFFAVGLRKNSAEVNNFYYESFGEFLGGA
jgi:hypothetical protein